MIIVGTAGHIDHGKSSIIKRLTGTDPDRLPEEKRRGMTIDLGFAFYKTRSGIDVGFVDVPGHERFVRNMIAGSGGVQAVMLIVAADDGWMPQSQEHFQITRLLGVSRGIVVINKVDLATEDWLELLREDIRDKVKNSYLADSPIVEVSAQTGDGFDDLQDAIDLLLREVRSKEEYGKARLYIDRSFVQQGIGGVVTGSLRGGDLSVGQTVSIWPSQSKGKVRTLHSAGQPVETVHAGERAALSFTGIDREELERGGVITSRSDLSYFADNPVLALAVEMLPDSAVPLTDRRECVLLVGTTEVSGEVRIFDSERILAGEKGVLFFRPKQKVLTLVGDRFILRLPSPMRTLGGGVVVDHLSRFPRRKELDGFEYLRERTEATVTSLVVSEVHKHQFVLLKSFGNEMDVDSGVLMKQAERLIEEGKLATFEDYLIDPESVEESSVQLVSRIKKLLESSSHLKGLSLDQIKSVSEQPAITTELLLRYLVSKETISFQNDKYNLAGRRAALKGVIKEAYIEISGEIKENSFAPPVLSKIASRGKIYQQAVRFMIESGEVYKCGSSFLFAIEAWNEIIQFIRESLSRSESVSVADMRKRFEMSRKFVIPIFEETDRLGLTKRSGDVRVRGDNFDV